LILIDSVIDYGQDAAHWTSFGEQVFSFTVPCLWNTGTLPGVPADTSPDVKKDGTVLMFMKKLKTYL